MADRLLGLLCRWHRAILVGSTALLAVGASQVALPDTTPRGWFLLIGGSIMLYASDVGREVQATATELQWSRTDPSQVQREVLAARTSRWLAVVVAVALGLVLIALILR